MKPRHLPALAAALLALLTTRAAAQDKVYRELSPAQLEGVLKSLKVEFKKNTFKDDPNIVFFDFERNKFPVRLSSYAGKDLMLDCQFKALPITKVNDWNVQAKFSRANLQTDSKGEFVVLESNLDVVGGVTEGTVKQFVERFDHELRTFDRFSSGVIAPLVAGPADDKILTQVTVDTLDGIFRQIKVKAEKKVGKGESAIFDFELGGQKLQLYSYGGKDLMLVSVFKKLPLEAVNKYNVERKFIRAVAYDNKQGEYTSLEANLDCEVGVTAEMIRHFITAYRDDAAHFAEYVGKQK